MPAMSLKLQFTALLPRGVTLLKYLSTSCVAAGPLAATPSATSARISLVLGSLHTLKVWWAGHAVSSLWLRMLTLAQLHAAGHLDQPNAWSLCSS